MKIALSTLLALSAAACALAGPPTPSPKPAAKIAGVKPAPKVAKVADAFICPITGEKVADIKHAEKSVYNGKTYYFCCNGCKPEFDKNPAKFAKAETKVAKPGAKAAPAAKPAKKAA